MLANSILPMKKGQDLTWKTGEGNKQTLCFQWKWWNWYKKIYNETKPKTAVKIEKQAINIQGNEKKLLKKKIAKKNSKSILSGAFDFDPEEYLHKLLQFDLKRLAKKNFLTW